MLYRLLRKTLVVFFSSSWNGSSEPHFNHVDGQGKHPKKGWNKMQPSDDSMRQSGPVNQGSTHRETIRWERNKLLFSLCRCILLRKLKFALNTFSMLKYGWEVIEKLAGNFKSPVPFSVIVVKTNNNTSLLVILIYGDHEKSYAPKEHLDTVSMKT